MNIKYFWDWFNINLLCLLENITNPHIHIINIYYEIKDNIYGIECILNFIANNSNKVKIIKINNILYISNIIQHINNQNAKIIISKNNIIYNDTIEKIKMVDLNKNSLCLTPNIGTLMENYNMNDINMNYNFCAIIMSLNKLQIYQKNKIVFEKIILFLIELLFLNKENIFNISNTIKAIQIEKENYQYIKKSNDIKIKSLHIEDII